MPAQLMKPRCPSLFHHEREIQMLYIKATCVSVCLWATKTRRGPETSEVLKTFEDLNRGVYLYVTTNSAGQGQGRAGQGQDRTGQGQGQGRAGRGGAGQGGQLKVSKKLKTTFFFF